MKKIFYTVEKQLQDVGDVEETTGWKYITVYHIINDDIQEMLTLEVENDVEFDEFLRNHLEEVENMSNFTLKCL